MLVNEIIEKSRYASHMWISKAYDTIKITIMEGISNLFGDFDKNRFIYFKTIDFELFSVDKTLQSATSKGNFNFLPNFIKCATLLSIIPPAFSTPYIMA